MFMLAATTFSSIVKMKGSFSDSFDPDGSSSEWSYSSKFPSELISGICADYSLLLLFHQV